MSVYSIKDLEQLSGIKAHTLRIWEQRYNFIKPKRTDTNIRFYDDNDLKLVLNISLLKDNGHKISKICKMCSADINQEVVKLTEVRLSLPEQIHALTLAMIDCSEDQFDKIMTANIAQYGLEETMMNLIFPFLNQIGVLWQTGSICPSHEHYITSLVKQKLYGAIQSHTVEKPSGKNKYMLFLPEGEFHELSLLFAWYLLKTRDKKVIYLGSNLDLKYIRNVYESQKPEILVSALTSCPEANSTQLFIDSLAEEFNKSTLILSGRQVIGKNLEPGRNVLLLNNFNELIDFCEIN